MSKLIIDYDLSVQPATDRDTRIRAAAPEMYELMCAAVRFLQTASQYHPLTVTEEKWEQKALELMAEIEGGGE